MGFVRESLSFLPGFLQPRVLGYTKNLEYAEFRAESMQLVNWYITFSAMGIKWAVYAGVLTIYFFFLENIKKRKDLLTLFCFSLLIYRFANIFSLVPSGGRMIVVADSFIYAFFVIFFSTYRENRSLSLLKTLMVPLLLLYCLVAVRTGMDYYGLMTLIGNPILAVILHRGDSINRAN